MTSQRPRPPRDPDDWFAGSDSALFERPRDTGAPRKPAVEKAALPVADDDWLDEEPLAAAGSVPREASISLRAALAVAVIVVLLVLAGLTAGGVFSGGGGHPATTPTTAPAITTSQPPRTTTAPVTSPAPQTLPAPATTLGPGDKGVQVRRLQRALTRLGYSAGVADGDYGSSTRAALTRFQTASALTADGVLGTETLQALEKALRKHG